LPHPAKSDCRRNQTIPDLQAIQEIRLNELSLCLPAESCVIHIHPKAALVDNDAYK
jgi:hypothetical protein